MESRIESKKMSEMMSRFLSLVRVIGDLCLYSQTRILLIFLAIHPLHILLYITHISNILAGISRIKSSSLSRYIPAHHLIIHLIILPYTPYIHRFMYLLIIGSQSFQFPYNVSFLFSLNPFKH